MDETTHQLSFRHRSEAKALKDALEKERRDLLRGVKGKKERKRVVSEHKRTVRAREKEMTERHKREAAELCARARANSASDTANTDTVPESKPQGAALVRGQLNTAAPTRRAWLPSRHPSNRQLMHNYSTMTGPL